MNLRDDYMRYINMRITYKTHSHVETQLYSDDLEINKAIYIAEDLMKTGRVNRIIFTDNHGSEWNLKELKKYTDVIQTDPHHVKVYFDGNFDLETNIAGLGCVIYYDQNDRSHRIRKNALIEEIGTSNEAEYAALHFAVKELTHLGVHHLPVQFLGDSLTVINQMTDEWACYEEELTTWADRIEADLEKMGIDPQYQVIPRSSNKEADQLATQALKKIEVMSTKEID